MPSSRSRNRPANATTNPAVEAGIERIDQLYSLGTTRRETTPSSPLLEGKTQLTCTEYVEKARRFANPKNGYSAAERKELIALCRRSNYTIGQSHIFMLLRIQDRAKRRAIQKAMAEQQWSLIDLDVQLKNRIGNPNSYAGKQVRKPADEADALNSVIQASNHFVKVFRAALRAVAEKSENKTPGQGLARQLCQHIETITDALMAGDPPPPKLSPKMRRRIGRIKAIASSDRN